jgi:hypothetical protein
MEMVYPLIAHRRSLVGIKNFWRLTLYSEKLLYGEFKPKLTPYLNSKCQGD